MGWQPIIQRLQNGYEVKLRPQGQSMTPKIKSGQEVTISPIGNEDVTVGMIVLAKVHGRHYLHLVTAVDQKGRIQISNNHGYVNGWTSRDRVYGLVTKVEVTGAS